VAQGQLISSNGEARGYLMLGASLIDLEALKASLDNEGYSTFEHLFISLGGGGYQIINGVLVGGEGHGLTGRRETTPSSGKYKTSLSGGYGLLNVGYLVYAIEGLNVYPFLGLGGGVLRLRIVERGAPVFEEVLKDPQRSVELSTGGLLVSVGVGADYLVSLMGYGREPGGFVFGLRIGYRFAPMRGDWKMDGMDVPGGPGTGLTGPYVHFMLGGGGISVGSG